MGKLSLSTSGNLPTTDCFLKMTRSRISLRGSQPGSGESDEESSDAKSPEQDKTISRGRKSNPVDSEAVDTNLRP